MTASCSSAVSFETAARTVAHAFEDETLDQALLDDAFAQERRHA